MAVRIVYFLLVGWWAGLLWSGLAYLLSLTVLLLPVGLLMYNRLPQVLTLKPVNRDVLTIHRPGSTDRISVPARENPFLLRAVYYFVAGWWLAGIWSLVAAILCLTVVGLPLGLMMYNRLPAVLTLKRAY